MSKQIVLFTRLTDDTDAEWKAWQDVWSEKNPNQQAANELKFEENDMTLIVKNGKKLLGDIPAYNRNAAKAFNFLQRLWEQINSYTDPEIIIAIHFGGGGTYEGSLQPWIKHFNQNGDPNQKFIAKYFLENFNKLEKPLLTEYYLGTEDHNKMINKINEKLNNLLKFYNELKKKPVSYRLSLIKHRLLNLLTPLQVDIEAFIEYNFKDKDWEYLILKWNKNTLRLLCDEIKSYINLIDDKNLIINDTNKYVELLISLRSLFKNKYPFLIPLLNSIKRNNKQKFQRIIRLHGNVYNKWLDELANALDELMKNAGEINVDFEKKNLEGKCDRGEKILESFLRYFEKFSKEYEKIIVIENKKLLINNIAIQFIYLGHYECNDCDNLWNSFLKKITSEKNYSPFIFFTTEELPRGDYPDSIYNESRLVREFFENSYCARTANYKNLIQKVKELILEVKSNKNRDYKNVFDELNKLVEGYSN